MARGVALLCLLHADRPPRDHLRRDASRLDELVTGMQSDLDIRVLSMAEHGPFLIGLGEGRNSTPGMEFTGPIAFVCKVDERDEVAEWWSFRA